MSELVTGEAVVLGLRPAKLASRAVAITIDLTVYWGVYVAVSIVLVAATSSLDAAAEAAVSVATLVLVLVGLPIAVETLSHGRSLGKLVFGLRAVRDDGGPIQFRHALVRGAVGAVEIQFSMGVIACIASLMSARGRRLGDVFAGTLVVRERVPAQYGQQPPPPPWLAGRLADVDLSGLPDGLWLAVRQYLSRMDQLDREVSWSMARRLAADVAARTGKAVPPGASPAAYLAAVVAERQAREARRALVTSGTAGPGGGAASGGAVPAGQRGFNGGVGQASFPAPDRAGEGQDGSAVPRGGSGSWVGFGETEQALPQGPPGGAYPGGSDSAAGTFASGAPSQHETAEPEGPAARGGTGFAPPA